MGSQSRTTNTKRQKERNRAEQQQRKQEREVRRRQDAATLRLSVAPGEDPDLVGMTLGPVPPRNDD